MGKNWKTTAAGVSAILIASGHLVSIVSGSGDSSHIVVDVSAIVTGIGLIFAKDHNVTGGDVRQ